jgi:hypothetical protein
MSVCFRIRSTVVIIKSPAVKRSDNDMARIVTVFGGTVPRAPPGASPARAAHTQAQCRISHRPSGAPLPPAPLPPFTFPEAVLLLLRLRFCATSASLPCACASHPLPNSWRNTTDAPAHRPPWLASASSRAAPRSEGLKTRPSNRGVGSIDIGHEVPCPESQPFSTALSLACVYFSTELRARCQRPHRDEDNPSLMIAHYCPTLTA